MAYIAHRIEGHPLISFLGNEQAAVCLICEFGKQRTMIAEGLPYEGYGLMTGRADDIFSRTGSRAMKKMQMTFAKVLERQEHGRAIRLPALGRDGLVRKPLCRR